MLLASPRYDVTVKGNMTQHVTWRSGDSNRWYGVCRKVTGVEGGSLVLTWWCRKPATECRVIDGVRKERRMQRSRRSVRGYPALRALFSVLWPTGVQLGQQRCVHYIRCTVTDWCAVGPTALRALCSLYCDRLVCSWASSATCTVFSVLWPTGMQLGQQRYVHCFRCTVTVWCAVRCSANRTTQFLFIFLFWYSRADDDRYARSKLVARQ